MHRLSLNMKSEWTLFTYLKHIPGSIVHNSTRYSKEEEKMFVFAVIFDSNLLTWSASETIFKNQSKSIIKKRNQAVCPTAEQPFRPRCGLLLLIMSL